MENQHQIPQKRILPGKEIFQLYDTYGFPIELSIEMAAEKGYLIDWTEFYLTMKESKNFISDKKRDKLMTHIKEVCSSIYNERWWLQWNSRNI